MRSPAAGRLRRRPDPRESAARDRRPSVGLSVVIPVYNEQDCLVRLWNRLSRVLRDQDPSWEVIFVDDGSIDTSAEQLMRIRAGNPGVRVLRMAAHEGQSAALHAGFGAARGDWIVTLDADLQNPPEEIPRLLQVSGGADLVFGTRRIRKDPWIRRVSSRIGNSVRNLVTGHRIKDTGCSLKLFRAEALRRLPFFHGMHRFLPALFVYHGLEVREVEVDHHTRLAGSSKYGIRNRMWRGLVDCLVIRWLRTRALRYEAYEVDGDDGVR